ncbi:TRAP transporter small permease subunit [Marinobacterium sp. D7]|uniref:TRAP transporter small permease n=1 Tax=Marinobacterium ramblicola TaxID=2849041 RepID=UPI001C2D6F54|nr:TRAP transporter small permease subunit [Marinobacterium ramblicola]MBV1788332.1 TRAP transporter small permease subunit [Marinobacterium ramblicola]
MNAGIWTRLHHGLLLSQKILMGVAMVAFSALVFVQVVIRYLFDLPLFGVEEIAVYLAVWLYFTGAGYGTYRGNHICAGVIDLMLESPRKKDLYHILVSLISLVLVACVLWICVDYFQWSLLRAPKSPELRFPLYYVHFAMVFGLVLMQLYSTVEFLRRLICFVKRQPYRSLAELDDQQTNNTTQETAPL